MKGVALLLGAATVAISAVVWAAPQESVAQGELAKGSNQSKKELEKLRRPRPDKHKKSKKASQKSVADIALSLKQDSHQMESALNDAARDCERKKAQGQDVAGCPDKP